MKRRRRRERVPTNRETCATPRIQLRPVRRDVGTLPFRVVAAPRDVTRRVACVVSRDPRGERDDGKSRIE